MRHGRAAEGEARVAERESACITENDICHSLMGAAEIFCCSLQLSSTSTPGDDTARAVSKPFFCRERYRLLQEVLLIYATGIYKREFRKSVYARVCTGGRAFFAMQIRAFARSFVKIDFESREKGCFAEARSISVGEYAIQRDMCCCSC